MSNQQKPSKGGKSATKENKKEVAEIKKGLASTRETLNKKKGK